MYPQTARTCEPASQESRRQTRWELIHLADSLSSIQFTEHVHKHIIAIHEAHPIFLIHTATASGGIPRENFYTYPPI